MGIFRTIRACAVLAAAALLGAGCGHKDHFEPYALDQTIALPAGDTVQTQLDGQRLDSATASYLLVTLPADGAVSLDSTTGVFNYTPQAGFIGNDSFTWQAADSSGTTNVATVTIEVVAAVASAHHHAVIRLASLHPRERPAIDSAIAAVLPFR